MTTSVLDGIFIGGAGGAIAGISVYTIQYIHTRFSDIRDGNKIYAWLLENTVPESFRSTKAIASYNNLTMDRVRYLCSNHPKIKLSTGELDDLWSLTEREPLKVGFFDVDW
ncbi:hypothetical protein [Marinomonas polaris]|uniref:hypothetical protein n=1 Tax=Marinomonas polaris TaxID=293552 RepID=UPI003F985127